MSAKHYGRTDVRNLDFRLDFDGNKSGGVATYRIAMPRLAPDSHAVDVLMRAIFERLEKAQEMAIKARRTDLLQERRRWASVERASEDVAALARSLEILNGRSK